MSETRDGGAAFPVLPPCDGMSAGEAAGYPAPETGMTLRDWFAGQALTGLLSDPSEPIEESHAGWYARHAYALADAMLAARTARIGEAA